MRDRRSGCLSRYRASVPITKFSWTDRVEKAARSRVKMGSSCAAHHASVRSRTSSRVKSAVHRKAEVLSK